MPQFAARWNGKFATEPDLPIVVTKTLWGFFPRATEISPGFTTGVALGSADGRQ